MGGSSGGSGAAAGTLNQQAMQNAPKANALATGMPGQGLGAQYLPKFQAVANTQGRLADSTQGPGKGLYQGAVTGAGYGAQTAKDVSGFSHGLIPYAQQIGQMGFDPQNALYDRTLQQVQDQQRAGQAARGISMSPYGAGLEGDATRNFNIDWQNQQLKRASDAATAMEGLGSSAFNLGSGATDLAASAGRMPYDAAKGLSGDKANAYSAVGNEVMGANQPRQAVIDDFLRSVGLAPGFTNAAASSQQAGTGALTSMLKLPLAAVGK
jgi:hypothetical protein